MKTKSISELSRLIPTVTRVLASGSLFEPLEENNSRTGRKEAENGEITKFNRHEKLDLRFILLCLVWNISSALSARDYLVVYHTTLNLLCFEMLLLFPVDRDTHEIFYRLQSNVFDAASIFQTNHVVHWNVPRKDIFFCVASWLFRITWCSFIACLSSRRKLTVLFVCHRTVGMTAVYQVKTKYDQDKFGAVV